MNSLEGERSKLSAAAAVAALPEQAAVEEQSFVIDEVELKAHFCKNYILSLCYV